MNNTCFAFASIVASSLLFADCVKATDPFEVRRSEMIGKTGNCIWNTDGAGLELHDFVLDIVYADASDTRVCSQNVRD